MSSGRPQATSSASSPFLRGHKPYLVRGRRAPCIHSHRGPSTSQPKTAVMRFHALDEPRASSSYFFSVLLIPFTLQAPLDTRKSSQLGGLCALSSFALRFHRRLNQRQPHGGFVHSMSPGVPKLLLQRCVRSCRVDAGRWGTRWSPQLGDPRFAPCLDRG